MPKYKVCVAVQARYIYEVEAENKEQAEHKGLDAYEMGKPKLIGYNEEAKTTGAELIPEN